MFLGDSLADFGIDLKVGFCEAVKVVGDYNIELDDQRPLVLQEATFANKFFIVSHVYVKSIGGFCETVRICA